MDTHFPSAPLPPGQRERPDFPRFGLGLFAKRFPRHVGSTALAVRGDVASPCEAVDPFASLPRVSLTSDFHCVTSWSVRAVRWSGVRFADFHREIVVPLVKPAADATLVVFRGQDGYATSLPLADLLSGDVLLADRLDDEPLPVAHGAPLRLVAPAHYGYKNPKHLEAIEYWRDGRNYRFPFPYPSLMDHPRGRVAFEERGRWVPAWLLRSFYRLLIPPTVRAFRRALERHGRRM